jgi:hypothetical protein
LFLRDFWGEYKDERDISGWEERKVILLVTKRYVFMAFVFLFLIRLVSREEKRAGAIGARIIGSFSPFYFADAIISREHPGSRIVLVVAAGGKFEFISQVWRMVL